MYFNVRPNSRLTAAVIKYVRMKLPTWFLDIFFFFNTYRNDDEPGFCHFVCHKLTFKYDPAISSISL